MEPKITRIYPNDENKDRCVIGMYKEYIRRRPTNSSTSFYLTPLPQSQIKTDIWYKRTALGIHSIEKTTKDLMKTIAKEGEFYSNTSLRRTAKCRLVDGGISREVASLKTGRISEAADRAYIHASWFEKDMS